VGPGAESACLGYNLVQSLIHVQFSIATPFVAFSYQSIDLKTVPFGVEEIARDGVSHLLVSVAYGVVDGHALRL